MKDHIAKLTRLQCAVLLAVQLLALALLFGKGFADAAARPAVPVKTDSFALVSAGGSLQAGADGFVLAPGGEGGAAAESAPFSLPAGSYEVRVRYSSPSDANTVTLVTDQVVSAIFEVTAPSLALKNTEAAFPAVLPSGVTDARVRVKCAAGPLTVSEVVLQPTADAWNRSVLWLAGALLVIDLAVWLLRHKTKNEIGVFAAVAAIGLFASLPFLADFSTPGIDLTFHLTRIEGIARALRAGQFPVRMQDLWYDGAGYPVSVMYGDAFLYFPAVLRVLGATLSGALNAFRVALNLATAGLAYFAFSRMLRSVPMGLLGSGMYTLCLYRFTNLMNRGALGEATAAVFFPLVLLGLYRICFEDSGRRGWLWLTLAMTGLLNCHLLSCEMAAGVMVLWALAFPRQTFRKGPVLAVLKAAGATVCLNLWFLVPFLDYSLLPMNVFEKTPEPLANTRVFLPQVFGMFPNVAGMEVYAPQGFQGEMGYTLGSAFLAGIFAMLYAAFLFWGQQRTEREALVLRLGGGSLVLSGVVLAAALGLFPLDALAGLSPLLAKVISSIQLLSRLLLPASALLTLAAVCGVWLLLQRPAAGRRLVVYGVCLCSVVSALYFFDESLGRQWEARRVYDATPLHLYTNHSKNEYLLAGTDPGQLALAVTEADGPGVEVLSSGKEGLRLAVRCRNTGDAPGRVVTPLLWYPYYRAADDATGQPLALGAGPNNRLQVELPAGYDGSFTVFYREPAHWRAAELASLVSLAALGALLRRGGRKAGHARKAAAAPSA